MKPEFNGSKPRTNNVYVGQPKKATQEQLNNYLGRNGTYDPYKSEQRRREIQDTFWGRKTSRPIHWLQQSILVRANDEDDTRIQLKGYAAAAYRNTERIVTSLFRDRNVDNKTAVLFHHISTH